MAHFIKLHIEDVGHDNDIKYVPKLFNLDTVITIEPSVSGEHSRIETRWSNGNNVYVKESLDEILRLSRELKII